MSWLTIGIGIGIMLGEKDWVLLVFGGLMVLLGFIVYKMDNWVRRKMKEQNINQRGKGE